MHLTSLRHIISPESLLTRSLSQTGIGLKITRIIASAISAVDPYTAVADHLKRSHNTLHFKDHQFRLDHRNTIIIGAGKAAVPMASASADIINEYFSQGIILVKDGYASPRGIHDHSNKLTILEAGHPLPDARGVYGTQQLINLLKTTSKDDLVLFLLSGGASALLTYPPSGISITDLRQTNSLLLACGAGIQEINCVRKHLDFVKGGQLTSLIPDRDLLTLILSDVVGDPLDVIASGPTVPDPTTFQQALDVLGKYNLLMKLPDAVVTHLKDGSDGKLSETPKAGNPLFNRVYNQVIGNNRIATDAAQAQARREGFNTLLITNYLQGEAQLVGKVVASIARQMAQNNSPIPRPACILLGGETTVTLNGPGQGGRNQETILATINEVAGLERTIIVSLATDGTDGPTDAAGAVATGYSKQAAQQLGLDPVTYLNDNNSYVFFEKLSDLIKTGPTQTNVNDIVFIFTY